MNLTKCSNGHFYDADKYASCPHCSGSAQAVDDGVTVSLSSDSDMPTEMLKGDDISTLNLNSSAGEENKPMDEGATISYYSDSIGTDPVVGWLVCLNGGHFGESFPLKAGRNFIGRSANMDVVLDTDTFVSRERHAVIIYEPKSRIFIAQAGDSRELFYMNDKVVLNNELIKARDIFTIGRTRLLFVPLCGENFSWDDIDRED